MTEAAIGDHRLIGDLHTAALISTDGFGRLVLLLALRFPERLRRPARPMTLPLYYYVLGTPLGVLGLVRWSFRPAGRRVGAGRSAL